MSNLLEVLKTLAIASKQNQPELLDAVVDPNCTFRIYGQAGISGTYKGVNGVYDMLVTLHQKTDHTLTFVPVSMVDNGSDLFFWAHQTATRPDGRALDTHISYLYRFRDGKLAEGHMVPTDQPAFDAFFEG